MMGIIGAGRMGTALARVLAAAGVPAALCTARCDRPAADPPPGCTPATLDDVLWHTDPVLLALPFPVAVGLASGPAGHCGDGRVLIDATNPGFCRDRVVPPGLSGGELIAAAATGWRTVKAFNTVPAEHLAATRIGGGTVTLPVAGPADAKPPVLDLAGRLGFEPVDVGGIESSREMEALAVLMARVSAAYDLHGRIGIRIAELDRSPAGRGVDLAG
ncbi:NADPH-dependent F420 reductase [Couchioplanes azureus]|uniref:NADPH-dependent F420 reductase n=1 Tax=Couchioplanes caeruleus TaxID=56438 RepID=UPI001670924F|nr:NAD(P)-binding domain-containing protein [Couchioplanes caeruleus]GGQ49153.1 NADP oxidoreductase [Couchioplanes caeruleus subsp. azureus]